MADKGQDMDATPTKAVSSLRSKFENLGQEKTTPQPSPVNRQDAAHQKTTPSMPRVSLDIPRPAASSIHHQGLLRPQGPEVSVQKSAPSSPRASIDIPRPASNSIGLGIHGSSIPSPQPRVRHTGTIEQRPFSMVDWRTSQPSPPAVTIDSPRSPPKNLSPRLPALSTRSPKIGPLSTSPFGSPVSGHVRALSNDPTAQQPDMLLPSVARTAASAPSTGAKGPPPVNRAGKPKIVSNKTSPVIDSLSHNFTGKEISPFNTPPSSADGTPSEPAFSPPILDLRTKPRIGGQLPGRHGYFMPPPIHHAVRDRKDEIAGFQLSRASTLPARSPRQMGVAMSSDGSEDQAGLQSSHVKIPASGRTSPVRSNSQAVSRTADRSAMISNEHSNFATLPRRTQASALTLGFERLPAQEQSQPQSHPRKMEPPAIPAPRRSVDIRRPAIESRRSYETRAEQPQISSNGHSRADDCEDVPVAPISSLPGPADYPDSTRANRRPPRFRHRPWEIGTGYDTRICAACGEYVCTTGYITRVWSIKTGESVLTLSHGETVKVTSMAWKPATDVADEGRRLWLGTHTGDILEVDIPIKQIVQTRSNAHARSEIIKIYRYESQLWSLDDQGRLHVWRPGPKGLPSLDGDCNAFRVARGHTASIGVGEHLWIATGKEIRVYRPTASSEAEFQLLQRPLCQDTAGDVTSAATMSGRPNEIYFGHSDGKVSVYDRHTFTCLGVHNVSTYKISTIAGVGRYLWAGYNTGMTYVYDTSTTPWLVKKDWRAHDHPVASIIVDHSSLWKMNRLQVVTLGTDNALRIWDGLLQQDWLDERMQQLDDEYCEFQEITASILTWNAGATKPHYLRDDSFFRNYFTTHGPPDMFVFGFQELVDLEDKKVTAKSFFKSKKNPSEQEHMSHAYRDWRDHLVRCLDDSMPPDQTYVLIHTASMVGLFTCVFVKTSLRARISGISAAEVKRGMGGLHGNKGALIVRLILDDSSLCFINCHLAAGQTQTQHRNNDIAAILESESLPAASNSDVFTSGGDGSMILDHEICILNGDLNYRIDAMTRDNVVRSVRENNLTKLLDRDQLLLSKKRNPGLRLRLFQEMPITFAPTYKYNVGTDEYDTSEKKRSPAWCDRVLFRGMGRVKCTEYRRWEVRVSDHRPVSARFKIRVKSIDKARREKVWIKALDEYDRFKGKVEHDIQLDYLVNLLGLAKKEAMRLLKA